jgi:hypothetical protein
MDLTAAAHARRELGPEYEVALVEAFLERLDRDIDERLNARVASSPAPRRSSSDPSLPIALGSLGLSIPLSAIAGGTGRLGGLLVAWTGIVAVNAAHAWGRRRAR